MLFDYFCNFNVTFLSLKMLIIGYGNHVKFLNTVYINNLKIIFIYHI